MKTKKILSWLLAALLGGCIPVMSLHPLYNKENVLLKENLLGLWVDDANESFWEFKDADQPLPAYELILSDNKGAKGLFIVHLVKLDNRLFLDIYPSQSPCGKLDDPNQAMWAYNAFFSVPVHTFMIIDSAEPQLKMRLTDDDDMMKLLKEDPNAINHELVKDYDGNIVLTATTKQLQEFVLKYADDARVFSKEVVLNRVKPKPSKNNN